MKKLLFTALLISQIGFAYGQQTQSDSKKSAAIAWFNSLQWREGFAALPAPSVNKQLLYTHYQHHPDRWKKVFDFLTHTNLDTLPLGAGKLGDDVNYNVQEYTTHEPGAQRLEAHRKYIDLQYVISGCELIGSGNLADAKEVVPYNPEKDNGNYLLPVFPYYPATSGYFFIFFPQQVHITGIQFGEKANVRKIVFKLSVE